MFMGTTRVTCEILTYLVKKFRVIMPPPYGREALSDTAIRPSVPFFLSRTDVEYFVLF